MNATQVGNGFLVAIADVLQKYKPQLLLETGTFVGQGSTTVIAEYAKGTFDQKTRFYSIECNPSIMAMAEENLSIAGLLSYVTLCEGLSIPRNLLPSKDAINELCSKGDIKMDHSPETRVDNYFAETQTGGDDDIIGEILNITKNKMDFALFDSAGHMGMLEFLYFFSLLYTPCIIALDDVNHIKHHRTFETLCGDKRFKKLFYTAERFGSAIFKYDPLY